VQSRGCKGGEKFGLQKGKQKEETTSSPTNHEKAWNRPITMIMGSKGRQGKEAVLIGEAKASVGEHRQDNLKEGSSLKPRSRQDT